MTNIQPGDLVRVVMQEDGFWPQEHYDANLQFNGNVYRVVADPPLEPWETPHGQPGYLLDVYAGTGIYTSNDYCYLFFPPHYLELVFET